MVNCKFSLTIKLLFEKYQNENAGVINRSFFKKTPRCLLKYFLAYFLITHRTKDCSYRQMHR